MSQSDYLLANVPDTNMVAIMKLIESKQMHFWSKYSIFKVKKNSHGTM